VSTPEHQHPIDPLSQALGRIEGRLEGLATRAELAEALRDVVTHDQLRGWIIGLGAWLTVVISAATWLLTWVLRPGSAG
jgi:hypothetical protein